VIKNFFRTEYAKLREMTFTEKRQYIWEYYKLHMFGFLIVAFLVGSLLNAWIFNPRPRDYLYIVWMGERVSVDQLSMLSEHLRVIVDEPERETVTVASYAITGDLQIDSALRTRFIALFQVGSLDVFLSTRDGLLEDILPDGFIQPVTEIMYVLSNINPTLYALLSERLLTVTFFEGIEGLEYEDFGAISMAGSPLLESAGIDTNDLYLSVVITSANHNRIARALEVFFA